MVGQGVRVGVTRPTLYVVSYAHLDTQWRWSFPQTIRDYLPNTVDRNVEYFRKYPNYIFNFTGASRYDLLKEYDPARFEVVRYWAKKGRWFAAGNQWEECDVLVPSTESLLRQILIGNGYFLREFGTASSEFMLPDSFGFPASLPSILAHASLQGFSTQKLTWNSAAGIPFNIGQWRGPDGKGVIAAFNAGNYGAVHRQVFSEDDAIVKRLEENARVAKVAVDYLYNGVGDRGGAPHEASMQTLAKALALPSSIKIVAGRADQMFRDLGPAQIAAMPQFVGDLLLTEHSAGSLTSQAFMKRVNRMNELLSDAAERASVVAELIGGRPYPQELLNRSWQLVLRSQSHDTISGTSVPKAYEYAWNDEFVAMNGFSSALSDAVGAVARSLDTRVEGVPVLVYNPLSIARTDLVEMVLPEGQGDNNALAVVNGSGELVPSQIVTGSDGRARALFLAVVPSVGFAVYGVSVRQGARYQGRGEATTSRLENERYRVTINTAGDVSSIYDRVAARELLAAPIRMAFQTEWPSEFPAWNMDWADRRQEPRGFVEGSPRVRVIENGPLRYALQIDRESENSTFREVIRLGSGDSSERVEFVEHIDWRARECSLKATFPLSVSNHQATYNWEPGTVQRGNNQAKQFEVPSHGWFDLSEPGGRYGVTVLSGAKYGSDKPNDNTLRLTLLYTPATTDEYCEQRSQDIGRHEISFGLVGHSGALSKASAHWQAQRFEQPLLAFAVSRHAGSLGKQLGWISSDHKEVSVQAIKRTEDGYGTLIRLQELEGKATAIKLQTHSDITSAGQANGLEGVLGPLESSRNEVSLQLGPYQLQSVRLATPQHRLGDEVAIEQLNLPYNVDAISWNYAREDGDLDGAGASLPAEMLPNTVTAGTVQYRLGPFTNGEKNALVPKGQVIELPRGYTRLGLLMARAYGMHKSVFAIGKTAHAVNVASWNGFLGQWDNRVFAGQVPNISYCIDNVVRRVDPAYVRTDRVAWFASHYHRRDGSDALYAYSYLFSYTMDIPHGETRLSLPNDEGLRIFAMSVIRDDDSGAVALTPLYPDFTRDGSFAQRFGAVP